MRKKLRDYLAGDLLARAGADARAAAGREADHRQGRRGHPQGQARRPPGHPAHQVDVLERPRGRPGIHPRPDRRARRRLQGMRRGHQDGEDARLPGGHQHHRLQGNRRAGDRGDVRVLLRARGGRPHHFARLRLRRRQEGHGQAPGQEAGGFLPHPRDDAARSSPRSRNGARRSPSSARRFIRNSWPANAS